MMRWIIGSSLKARGFMLFVAALLIVMGAVQLRSVPKDVLPEFTPPTVEVQTGGARPLGQRGRGAHHRPARARTC